MVKNIKTVSSGKKKIPVKKITISKKKKPSPAVRSRVIKAAHSTLITSSKYKAVVEQASDSLFIHDFNGRFVEVNDKACKSLGYTREELLSMTVMDIEQDFDLKGSQKEWRKVSDGVNFTLKGRQKRKDGTIFPVEIKFGAFTQAGKRLIICFVKDITGETNEEERRKKTEERFRLTLDSILEGAQIIGFDWKYIYINAAAEKQNKRPKEELLGKVYAEMWPGVENTELFAILERCMYERIPGHFDNYFVFPDGSDGWYELSIQPVPEGIFILSIDITSRKTAEEKYRESREQFYGLYKNSVDAILLTIPDGEVIAANDGACRMFQRTEEELCGIGRKGLVDMTDPRLPGLVQKRKENSEAIGELTFIRKDGSKFEGEISSTIFHDSKGNPRTSMIIRDVSERYEYEQKIKESETHFRTLADSGQALIWSSGLDKKCDYFNIPWLEFTGRKLEEELGDGWAEGIHPDDLERCIRIYTDAFDKREKFSMEYRIRHNSGEYRWILDDGCPRYNSKGEFVGYIGFCLDITESKKAVESLRENETRFRNVFERSSFGMVIVNKDTKFSGVNKAFCEMTGYTEEELKNLTIQDITHPDDRPRDAIIIPKLMKGEMPVYRTEKRYIRKDGNIFWAYLTVTANFSSAGEFLYNVATLEDITERKLAEKALIKLKERLELATEAAKMGIWDWDIEKNILTWDDRMYKLYGVRKEEFPVAYDAWLNGLHPDDRESSNENSMKAVRGEAEYDTEFRVVWPDGSVHWLKADGEVFRDADGTPLRMAGVNYDITERKKTEKEYKEILDNFETIVRTSPQAVIATDLEGHINVWNNAAEKIFGWTSAEVKGKANPIIPEESDYEVKVTRDKVLAGETINSQERKRLRKNGDEIIVSSSATALRDAAGNITGILSIAEDITDRKKDEQVLIENEKKYRYLFDNNPLPMWIYDLETLAFLEVNEAAVDHYGFSREEFLIMTLKDIRPSDDWELLEKDVANTVDVLNFAGQWRHKKKNGEIIFVEIVSHLVDFNGKPARLVLANDITSKVKAQNELRESEEKYRTLIEIFSDAVFINQNDRIIYLNAAAIKLFGANSESDIIGKSPLDVFHPDYHGIIKDRMKKLNDFGTKAGAIEEKIIRLDGNTVDVEVTATLFMLNGMRAIQVVLRDITEQKTAQSALKTSEERFRQIAETSGVWVWEVDRNGLYTYVNKMEENILGYTVEEVIGKKHFYDFFVPEVRESLKRAALAAFEKKQVIINFENPNLHKDGHTVYLETSGLPMYDKDGNFSGYRGADRDITPQRLAIEALTESEASLQQAQQIAKLGNWDYNLLTSKVIMSRECFAIFELDEHTIPENLFGEILDVMLPEDRVGLMESIEESRKTGKGQEYEYRINTASAGVKHIYSISQVSKNNHGEVIALHGIVQDITKTKQAEEEIIKLNEELEHRVVERTAQLQEAVKELEAFSYSVSHDLRAPLRAITGFTKILKDDYSSVLSGEGNEYLNDIISNSQKMATLIDDLLELSRYGRKQLDKTRISMNDMFADIFEIEKARSGKNVKLEIFCVSDAYGDHNLIKQVIINLISNAIKFSSKSENPTVTVSCEKTEDEIIYCVKDNGVGFDMKYAHKLFGVFQRLHSIEEFDGTGVGLAIVQRIVNRHGGRIWAESEPGKGAAFYFTLPV